MSIVPFRCCLCGKSDTSVDSPTMRLALRNLPGGGCDVIEARPRCYSCSLDLCRLYPDLTSIPVDPRTPTFDQLYERCCANIAEGRGSPLCCASSLGAYCRILLSMYKTSRIQLGMNDGDGDDDDWVHVTFPCSEDDNSISWLAIYETVEALQGTESVILT